MPASDEHDPYSETASSEQQPDPELLGSFDAFRARRAQERAEAEPFPGQFEQPYAQLNPPEYELVAPNATEGTYTAAFPPPPDDEQVHHTGRRPWRSIAILGGVAVLAVGLSAGVYAAVQSPGGGSAAASPPATASASASPSPDSKAAKGGKVVTERLTVTAVNADSFTATTARGGSVVVHLTPQTRFGTTARPFMRTQLVPGADIFARLRREADGTIAATVIAAAVPSGAPVATPTA